MSKKDDEYLLKICEGGEGSNEKDKLPGGEEGTLSQREKRTFQFGRQLTQKKVPR